MAGDYVIFSIVPIDVWLDKRLRLETVRVLGALLSFRGKDTNTVWPTRKSIEDRCGLPPAKISEATSELVRLGWLKKEGKGGFSKATRYTIVTPEIVTDSVTVPEKGTEGVPQSVTGMRVPEKVRGKELTNNKPEDLTKKVSRNQNSAITIKHFLDACEARGEKAILEHDPVFEYADTVGIDREMLVICWQEFKAAYLPDDSKRQKDWRAHFRNAVRRNWYKLWYIKEGEVAQWTSVGEQARRAAV